MTRFFFSHELKSMASLALDVAGDRLNGDFIALEPRMVFDGAGLAVATDAFKQADDTTSHAGDGQGADKGASSDTSSTADKAALAKALSEAALPQQASPQTHDVVFIDSRVSDLDAFRKSLPQNTVLVVIDSQDDGIAKMTEALKSGHNVSGVHIISHGVDGAFKLGKSWIDTATLKAREAEIKSWSSALVSGADILIYGCDVSKTSTGETLIKTLASETGADVAASADAVGLTSHGADWTLEKTTGKIETSVVAPDSYSHALAVSPEVQVVNWRDDVYPVISSFSPGAVTRSTTYLGTENWTNDTTPTFYGTGNVGAVIRLYVLDSSGNRQALAGSAIVDKNGNFALTVGQYATVDSAAAGKLTALTPPTDNKIHLVTTQQDGTNAESVGVASSTFYINLSTTAPPIMTSENGITNKDNSAYTGSYTTTDTDYTATIALTAAQQAFLKAGGGTLIAYRVDAQGNFVTSNGNVSSLSVKIAPNSKSVVFAPFRSGFYTNLNTAKGLPGIDAKETYYFYLADAAGNVFDGDGKTIYPASGPVTKSPLSMTLSFQQLEAVVINGLSDNVGVSQNISVPSNATGSVGVIDDVTPTITGKNYTPGTQFKYVVTYFKPDGTKYIAGSGTVNPTSVDASGNWKLDIPDLTAAGKYGDGIYQVSLQAVNAVANSAVVNVSFALDRAAPTFHLEDASGPVQNAKLTDGALVDGVSLVGETTKAAGSKITIEVLEEDLIAQRDATGAISFVKSGGVKTLTFTATVGVNGKWSLAIPSSAIGTGMKYILAKATDVNGSSYEMADWTRLFITSASTPGGIGQDGLALWYDPSLAGGVKDANGNAITPTSTGTSVSSLTDFSGNGLDATQTNLALRPVVVKDASGRIYLTFTAAYNQATSAVDYSKATYLYLPTTVLPISLIYSGQLAKGVTDAAIVATQVDANSNTPFNAGTDGKAIGGSTGFYISDSSNTPAGYGYNYPISTGKGWPWDISKVDNNGQAIGAGQPWIIGTTVLQKADGSFAFTIDGKAYSASAGTSNVPYAALIGSIGGGFSGNIGAVIAYSRALSSAETAILANVQSQEFAQALAKGTTDYFVVRTPTMMSASDIAALQLKYSHDVAGILNDGTSSVTNVANGGLIVSDKGFLTANSGIFFGNDGATSSFTKQTGDANNPGVTRFSRTWAVDVTNGNPNGKVDLSFDVAALAAQAGQNWSDVVKAFNGRKGMSLAWRASESDPWQTIATSDTDVVLSGGKVTFANLNVGAAGLQKGFITLMDGPSVLSITPETSGDLATPVLTYKVVFSENVTGLTTDSFTVTDQSNSVHSGAVLQVEGTTKGAGSQLVTAKLGSDGKYFVTVSVKAWPGADKATLNYNFLNQTGVDTGSENAGNVVVKTAYTNSSAAYSYTVATADPVSFADDVGATKPASASSGTLTDDATPTLSGTANITAKSGGSLRIVNIYDGADLIGTADIVNGKWSFTPPAALKDGLHKLTVKGVDLYGNLSASSMNFDINIDATAPTVVSVAREANTSEVTNADSLTFVVTFSDAFKGLTANNFIATGEGGKALTVSGASLPQNGDGKTWLVTLAGADIKNFTGKVSLGIASTGQPTDLAGNALSTTLPTGINYQTYTLNNSAPVVNIDRADDNVGTSKTITTTSTDRQTDDQTPTLSGTVASGSKVDIYSVVNSVETKIGSALVTGTNWSFTPTTLSFGAYTFRAKATDALGNIGTSADFTLSITSGPQTPVIQSYVDNVGLIQGNTQTTSLTDDATPLLTITAQGATLVDVYDGSTKLGTATKGQGDIWTFALTKPLADGLHNLTVKAVDSNNVTNTSAIFALTVDTKAPTVPSVGLANDTGLSNIDRISSNGQINVSGIESGATWQYSTDSGKSWTNGTGTSFQLSEGIYVDKAIQVRQIDQAGNLSVVATLGAVTIDKTAPAAPGVKLDQNTGPDATDGITNNNKINVSLLESTAAWEYSIDGGKTWTAGTGSSFQLKDGTYADPLTIAAQSNQSNYAIRVRQIDLAGNISAATVLGPVTIDTSAPTMPGLGLEKDTGADANDHVSSNGKFTVSGIESGATWQYSTDSGKSWTNGTGTSFELSEGLYADKAIQVRQIDQAGNLSAVATLGVVTIDTTTPVVSISITKSELEPGEQTSVTFVFSEPIAIFDVSQFAVTGGQLSSFAQSPTDPKIYTALFTASSAFEGTAKIAITSGIADLAGNPGKTASVNVTISSPQAVHQSEVVTVVESIDREQVNPEPISIDMTSRIILTQYGEPILSLTGTGPRQSTVTTVDGRILSADIVASTGGAGSKSPLLEFSTYVKPSYVELTIFVRDTGTKFRSITDKTASFAAYRIVANSEAKPWIEDTQNGKILVRRDGPSELRFEVEIENSDGTVVRKKIAVDAVSGQFEILPADKAGFVSPDQLDDQIAKLILGNLGSVRSITSGIGI